MDEVKIDELTNVKFDEQPDEATDGNCDIQISNFGQDTNMHEIDEPMIDVTGCPSMLHQSEVMDTCVALDTPVPTLVPQLMDLPPYTVDCTDQIVDKNVTGQNEKPYDRFKLRCWQRLLKYVEAGDMPQEDKDVLKSMCENRDKPIEFDFQRLASRISTYREIRELRCENSNEFEGAEWKSNEKATHDEINRRKIRDDFDDHLSAAWTEQLTEEQKKLFEYDSDEEAKLRKKKRKKKNPQSCKRHPSAFILYCNERRSAVTKHNPTAAVKDIQRILGAQWRKETDEVKKRYKEISVEQKNRTDIKLQIEQTA